MMKSRAVFSIAIAAAILVGATAVSAGEDDITYRKATMKAVGGHMKAIATILKKGVGDIKDVAIHANAMAGLAKISATSFPEGSGPMDGKTETKMDVWEKPEEFKKVTMAFIVEANKLAAIGGSGDKAAIGAQLGALGKNGCKACHDGFREKKK